MVIDEIVNISKERVEILLNEIDKRLRDGKEKDFAGNAIIIINTFCKTPDEIIFVSYIIGSMEGAERMNVIATALNNPDFTKQKTNINIVKWKFQDYFLVSKMYFKMGKKRTAIEIMLAWLNNI